jgi:hypothetical protein
MNYDKDKERSARRRARRGSWRNNYYDKPSLLK